MRVHVLSGAAVLLLSVVALAQSPPAAGAISGVVRDGATGAGLSQVMVELRAPSTGAPLARLTRQVTDAHGRFVFRSLPPGDGYTLQAARPGYANGAWGQTTMFAPSGRLSLTDGQWFSRADITLWKPAALSGRVIDEAGEPAVGIYVRALPRISLAGAPQVIAGPTARTDDRGDYRIAGLAPGTYVVYVPSPATSVSDDLDVGVLGKPAPPPRIDAFMNLPVMPRTDALLDPVNGHRLVVGNHVTPPPPLDGRRRTYGPTFHPGGGSLASAAEVSVGAGEERSGLDIALQPVPAVDVFGRLVGAPDAMRGVLLRLVPRGFEGIADGAEAATSTVRADGRFAFLSVPAGDYVISASASSLGFVIASAGIAEPLPSPPGTRVAGSQSGTLAAAPAGVGFIRQSAARDDDFFVRAPLTVGGDDLHEVVVQLETSMSLRGRLQYEGTTQMTVEQAPRGGGSAVGANDTIVRTAAPTRPASQPTIVAEPAFADAALGIARAERPAPEADQDRLAIHGLRKGEYVIRVTSGADRYVVQSVVINGVDHTKKPFDSAALTPISEVVITLTDKLTEIRGTVTDDRSDVVNGTVLVFPVERAEWRGYGLTPLRLKTMSLSGSSDFMVRGLPAGDYFVAAVAIDQSVAWQDPAFLERVSSLATRISIGWGDSRQLSLSVIRVPQR